MIFNTVGNYLWIIQTFTIYHRLLAFGLHSTQHCLFRILHPHFQCRNRKATPPAVSQSTLCLKTHSIIFQRLTPHSFSYLLLPKHVLASSLGVQTGVLLLDGLASLRMGRKFNFGEIFFLSHCSIIY